MKYFTMDWWRGIQDYEIYDPVADYQTHLAKIRDQLPPDLVTIQETISLHDARLREIALDSELNSLEIHLDGSDGAGHAQRYILSYQRIHTFRSTADPKVGLAGPHGYGDLGYYEADLTDDGHPEHRLLFSSGIEFQIIFGDFRLGLTGAK